MSYQKSGVDIHAADEWVNFLGSRFEKPQQLISGIGEYAAVYALNDEQHIALSCDGVGTKLLWTVEGLGAARDLAQDLVAMNVNDVLCVGADPLLFLDYLAVGSKEMLKSGGLLQDFVKGLHESSRLCGQFVVGGETAQMPDLYGKHGFDCAGFSLGTLDPKNYLHCRNIEAGDELWGWKSSGPHSNGFSWLRKIFNEKQDRNFIVQHLMKPTDLYVERFKKFRIFSKQNGGLLKGAFHITGSGFLNLLRTQPEGRSLGFDMEYFPEDLPLWLDEVKKRAQCSYAELAQTFNMGFGFMLVVKAKHGIDPEQMRAFGLQYLGKAIDENVVRVKTPKWSFEIK